MDWPTHINNIRWGGCCLTISLDLKGKDYQITGKACLKNFGYCTATFVYNVRFLSPNVLFLILWNDCYGGFLAMKSSATTPLLLLKIYPLLWATLLSMPCSCILKKERSIHRLILQYFATVSNYKVSRL